MEEMVYIPSGFTVMFDVDPTKKAREVVEALVEKYAQQLPTDAEFALAFEHNRGPYCSLRRDRFDPDKPLEAHMNFRARYHGYFLELKNAVRPVRRGSGTR